MKYTNGIIAAGLHAAKTVKNSVGAGLKPETIDKALEGIEL